MLDYLEIEEFSFISNDTVKIWIEDGKVHYSVDFMTKGKYLKDEIADCTPDKLEIMIAAIHIDTWKKHYEPVGVMYMDGTSWTVKYKVDGEKVTKYTGENAWPQNLKNLLKVIKVITGDLGELE